MQHVHLSKQSEKKYSPSQTKPKHYLFVEALSYLGSLITDSDRLTVTETKDSMPTLADNYDPVLYNRYSKV